MQMGDHVANMLAADLAGATRPAFRYFDKGDMATIGRMAAVARVAWPFKAHWSGFPAWITWITVHIFFLIGYRNRIAVFAAWIWTYFTFTRAARLITGDQSLPGWKEQVTAGPPELRLIPVESLIAGGKPAQSGGKPGFDK
jgi:NADH dehydrogenase